MKNALKVLLIIAVGLSVGLALGYLRLRQERAVSAEKILKLEQRADLLHKRYTEQKALEASLLRTKVMLEGQKRAVQGEMDKLEEEKKVILEEKARLAEMSSGLQARISGLEQRLKDAQDRHAGIKAEKETLDKMHRKALEDHKNQMAKLNAQKKGMENDFKAALSEKEQKLGRCASHNQKLSAAAEELLQRYENKGVFTSVLQREPFTQIRRVEIENLIDEYRTRIEDNRLEKKARKSE
ncbi:MAG: hypothetical protein JXL84_17480 [Deltaproteobacteria bacterium]|nr:hypothetical protein [Deltaproteobacteria bacterium]